MFLTNTTKITNNHKCSSTFGTILPCTLLLYAHCLVQTRNDKYLKGPLSLLQVRSLKKNVALIRIFITQSNLSLRASSLYDK